MYQAIYYHHERNNKIHINSELLEEIIKEELINANDMEEFNCIQKDNNIRYQYVFPELVNVSDIKYIIYDNKEYKEME